MREELAAARARLRGAARSRARARGAGRRRRRARARGREAAARAGAERHRRRAAHEPRAARRCPRPPAARSTRSRPATARSSTTSRRASAATAALGVERWLARLTGARGRDRGQQRRGRAAARARGAGGAGRKVLVSRGELVEIGGSFRVPEIMERERRARSSRSAPPTARTCATTSARSRSTDGRRRDPARAPSNFRIEGFTARAPTAELAALAHRAQRCRSSRTWAAARSWTWRAFGLEHEPTVAECLAAGADLVTFSGRQAARRRARPGSCSAAATLRRDGAQGPVRARAARRQAGAGRARGDAGALRRSRARDGARCPCWRCCGASPGRAARARRAARRRAGRARARARDAHRARATARWAAARCRCRSCPAPSSSSHPEGVPRRSSSAVREAEPPVIGSVKANAFRLDPRTLTETEVGMAAIGAGRGCWAVPDRPAAGAVGTPPRAPPANPRLNR